MREISLRIPEIMLLAGIRTALGAGLGLLAADKFNKDARRGAGWALLLVGAITSIPIVIDIVSKGHATKIEEALEKRAA